MRFRDCLTSVMNGVRVRRKSWPENDAIDVLVRKATVRPFGTYRGIYTFTTDDDSAEDWEIVTPKPEPRK